MSRITKDEVLPDLQGSTLTGNSVQLIDYIGKPLILSLYRYAACPLCNMRIQEFISNYNSVYENSGINALAVFQSPLKSMRKYITDHNAPFEIIADPKQVWYNALGLNNSWTGFLKGGLHLNTLVKSWKAGRFHLNPEGPMHRLPADFLINSEGIVDVAYYAKDIGDHISFERIDDWIETLRQ